MNVDLYLKYGNYSDRGYFISDHEKYDYYQKHPKERRKKTILAWLSMLIPFCGIIVADELYEEMGEDIL